MNRQELYQRVMRRADTEGTSINAAEVSRVCHILLDELKKELNPKVGTLSFDDQLEEEEHVLDYDADVADDIIINIIIDHNCEDHE